MQLDRSRQPGHRLPMDTQLHDQAIARERHMEATEQLRARAARLGRLVLLAVAAALLLRGLFYEPFSIPSQSMRPALVSGDTVFVAKWPYGFGRHALPLSPGFITGRLGARLPERGDVIVFKTPRDNQTDFIKRVIGLPGDSIAMRGGRLWINGALVPERSACTSAAPECAEMVETLPGGHQIRIQNATRTAASAADREDLPPTLVPPDMLFLLGDNRDTSADSRYSLAEGGIGLVPLENVIGRADFVLFSQSSSGFNPRRIGHRP